MPKGNWQIIQGDCCELLKGMKDGQIDLGVADPPWVIDWEGYDSYKDNVRDKEFLKWAEVWMREMYRVIKRYGSFWLAMSHEYVSEFDVLAKRVGFHKRHQITQYSTFGVNCKTNFSRNSHFWLYYTKSKAKRTFNGASHEVAVPSARILKYKDKRGGSNGKVPDSVWVIHPDDLREEFGTAEDTWLISRVCGSFGERVVKGTHGKAEKGEKRKQECPQMPRIAMDRIIRTSSNPGDHVLDPFGGTFSTGASAVALGRNFTGFEISCDYVKRGNKRLEDTMFFKGEVDGKT